MGILETAEGGPISHPSQPSLCVLPLPLLQVSQRVSDMLTDRATFFGIILDDIAIVSTSMVEHSVVWWGEVR